MSTTIRLATRDDIDLVQKWGRAMYEVEKAFEPHALYFGEQYRERDLGELSNPNALLLIAEYQAQPVGYLYAYLLDMPEHLSIQGRECIVEAIYLEEVARGKGIADKLLRTCVGWAEGRSVRMRAGIYAGNTASSNLFRRLGFDAYHLTVVKVVEETI